MTESTDKATPTARVYGELDKAYDGLNAALFGGELPSCLITLQRKRRVFGYFCDERFPDAEGGDRKIDEIALNPQYMQMRTPTESLSTLAHEMVHLWQHHFGTPTKSNPHNREWADKMKSIGLQPCGPNGEETGRSVSHLIVEGGLFSAVAGDVEDSCDLSGIGDLPSSEAPRAKSGKYAKYTCPKEGCDTVARGKPGLDLRCGDHGKMDCHTS